MTLQALKTAQVLEQFWVAGKLKEYIHKKIKKLHKNLKKSVDRTL